MTSVLIVDDEKYVRMGIISETDWSLIGCEVVGEASNGLEALEKAETLRPDLIISDIRMPKMDGIEFSTKYLEKHPDTKIIFLTAYNDFEYARQAIRIGISDYLLKPFQDGELEASIQRLLHVNNTTMSEITALENELVPLKPKSEISNKCVQNAIEYIEKHFRDTDFSIGKLAESMGVSEGHISRLFKTEAGISINNYLTRYRIRKAMDYLKDVSIKVYEVADMIGYQDIAYFSNTFKKLVGKSPSDYQSNGIL